MFGEVPRDVFLHSDQEPLTGKITTPETDVPDALPSQPVVELVSAEASLPTPKVEAAPEDAPPQPEIEMTQEQFDQLLAEFKNKINSAQSIDELQQHLDWAMKLKPRVRDINVMYTYMADRLTGFQNTKSLIQEINRKHGAGEATAVYSKDAARMFSMSPPDWTGTKQPRFSPFLAPGMFYTALPSKLHGPKEEAYLKEFDRLPALIQALSDDVREINTKSFIYQLKNPPAA